MENSWKTDVLNTDDIHFADAGCTIVQGIVPETLSLQFHKKMPKGAALRELTDQPFQLAYWETPYYKDTIEKYFQEVDRKNTIVADIGCGDGRFTEFLLELGFSKIIATDIDLVPLQSLAEHLHVIGAEDKVLLINSGVEYLPLKSELCHGVLSIGVLYYLNDHYDQGLKEIARIMKPSGVLVHTEPDMEGALYRSIIFESLGDVLQNYFERIFKEEKGETPFKFKLFTTEDEIITKLKSVDLSVQDKYGLSLFPLILRIMTVRGTISREDLAEHEGEVRAILDFLHTHGKLYKTVIWKSTKQVTKKPNPVQELVHS